MSSVKGGRSLKIDSLILGVYHGRGVRVKGVQEEYRKPVRSPYNAESGSSAFGCVPPVVFPTL